MNTLKNILKNLGLEIHRYPYNCNPNHRRQQILTGLKTNLILDVGAHCGEYGNQIFDHGYQGACISFEPVAEFYGKLQLAAQNNSQWDTHNFALGKTAQQTEINVAGTMSSMADIDTENQNKAFDFTYTSKEQITVKTLDEFWETLDLKDKTTHLKLDVQGLEDKVIEGGKVAIKDIKSIEIELNINPFYAGQKSYTEMIATLGELGFELWCVAPGYSSEKTGRMAEFDAIFARS